MKFLRVGTKLIRTNPSRRLDRFGVNYSKDSVESGDDVYAVLVHEPSGRSHVEGVFSDRRDALRWIRIVGKGSGTALANAKFQIVDISLDHWYD